MSGILKRLADVARSYIQTGDHKNTSAGPERLVNDDKEWGDDPGGDSYSRTEHSQGQKARADIGSIPQQVVKDLATFSLTPPSSLKAVKNARNREVKKYHSDKFINDPEKLETSKEIMQIYNAAYDRLRAYYRTYD